MSGSESTVINYRFFSFAFFGRKWFSPPLVTTVKTNTTHPFASVKLQEDVENSRKLPSLDYPGGQLVDSHEDFQLTFFTKIGWLIGRWLDQFRIMPRTAKSWWACDSFSDIFSKHGFLRISKIVANCKFVKFPNSAKYNIYDNGWNLKDRFYYSCSKVVQSLSVKSSKIADGTSSIHSKSCG